MGWAQFGENWPGLRLQQAGALPAPGSVVDTSGMAVITDLGDTLGPPHPKNKTEVGRRMALQALHVAYAYQSLGNGSGSTLDGGDDMAGIPPGAALAQLPYDGFADGPLLLNASLTPSDELTLRFSNAQGMALKPTHGCGGGYNASNGGGCCKYDRNFEVSTAAEGYADSLWEGVAPQDVSVITGEDGTGQVVLKLPSALLSRRVAPKRVRSNHQMYPQCVLTNRNELVAAPFLLNVSEASVELRSDQVTVAPPAKGVALTPPMGFNSWNFYHCNIDERAIKQIATTLKSSGLADKGYRYVNIDVSLETERERGARCSDALRVVAYLLNDNVCGCNRTVGRWRASPAPV